MLSWLQGEVKSTGEKVKFVSLKEKTFLLIVLENVELVTGGQ